MKTELNLEEIINWNIESGVDVTTGDLACNFLEVEKNEQKKALAPTRQATTSLAQAPSQSIKVAKEIAKKAEDLDELKESIKFFDGCAIKLTATNTLFGEGSINPKIMFIGEAPNAEEDRKGKVFYGKNEKLINNMIKSMKVKREDCYLSNILPWRPPGNRTPTTHEFEICLPFIKREIELVNPESIILLGGSVANALLENESSISQLRGKILEYKNKKENIKAIVSFNLAYLLLNPLQKAQVWADLARLKKAL